MFRMNYRNGFQRLYAVFTLLWIVGTLLFLPTERWDFWRKWNFWDQVEAHVCDTPCSPEELKQPWIADRMDQQARLATQPKWKTFYEYITLSVPVESRVQRFLWLLGLLVLPPALGYLVLFLLVPWVVRGFRPLKQHNASVT